MGTDLVWQMTWDDVLGQPTTLTDPNGDYTTVAYDELGRLSSVAQNNLPPHARYAYEWDGPGPIRTHSYVFDGAEADLPAFELAWQNGAPWRESASVVNGAGEALYSATRLEPARWIIGGYNERDARGRTIYVADNVYWSAAGLPTSRPPGTESRAQTLAYDALGRLVTQTLPTGAQKHLSYEAFCQTVTADDLAPVSSCSDGLGRVKHTERVVETGTEFVEATYDAAGRITAMTLPQAVQHTFAYDSLGRLIAANDPDIGPRSLSYDDRGFLIEHQNGIPQSVTFTYDDIGRLLTRSSDGATFTYHYDVQKDLGTGDRTLGRLGWVDEPDGHVELAYDQFGRAITTRRTIKTLTAAETTTLSPSGLVLASSHANSDFSATVSYDAAGRATQVNSGLGMLWQATGIDAAGRIMQEQFGNGVTQYTARDVLGQPSNVSIYRPGEVPTTGVRYYDVALTRNSWGAVTNVTDNDGGVGLDHKATFSYDSAGRLTGATMGSSPGNFQFGYTYDSLQNMITRTQPVNATSLGTLLGTYRYGEAGAGPRQLTSVLKPDATVHNFVYDAAGRVTNDGNTVLTYNGLDQLVSAQLPGEVNPVEHGYGYDGLRTFTKDPAGNEQYWFTPNLRQHDGLREHYVKLGSRIIAKVTQADVITPPADAGVADAGVTVWRGGGGRYARPVAVGLFALCLLFAAAAIARRRAGFPRWMRAVASTCIVAMFALLMPACTWIGSSERPVWQHQKTTYFHYGFGAGPTLTTREDSTVVEERRYEPFGQPIDAYREAEGTGTPSTGLVDHVAEPTNSLNKETDPSTGWSYHGARWMAPQTGRWLTPDPPSKGPDPGFMGEPWSVHPYQYVGQNPVLFWDPDGQKRVCPDSACHTANDIQLKSRFLRGVGGQTIIAPTLAYYGAGRATSFERAAALGKVPYQRWADVTNNDMQPIIHRVTGSGGGSQDVLVGWKLRFFAGDRMELYGRNGNYLGDGGGNSLEDSPIQLTDIVPGSWLAKKFGRLVLRRGFSIAGGGGRTGAMSMVRKIKPGEKLDDIINEGKALTFTTGNEHALVKLANGERALVSGGPGGIMFKQGQVKRIFGHTHPTSAPPSAADFDSLRQLGQTQQTVFHGGEVTKIRP